MVKEFEPGQLFLVRSAIVQLEDELEEAYKTLVDSEEPTKIAQRIDQMLSKLQEHSNFIRSIVHTAT